VAVVAHQALLLITAAAQLLQAITAALAVPALAFLILLLCAAATTLLMAVRSGLVPMRAGAITGMLKRRSKERIALAHLLRR